MSFAQSQDAKEQVRQAVNIVDLVGSYLELHRQGANMVGLCPWHDDTKPSLNVNPARQSWKCWVCDDGGDVFSFLMKCEGVGFREALEMLAERAGISLATAPQPKAAPGSANDKKTLFACAQWAERQFHEFLVHDAAADPARQYLQQRGVSSDSIARYHIGFAPEEWSWLLDQAKQTAFSPEVLEAVGLLRRRDSGSGFYDFFRGRVIFSIRDTQDRPIAFGGRILPEFARPLKPGGDAPAKYFNSPETRLFTKSDNLYGLDVVRDEVRTNKQMVVMEGYTDVIMANQFGVQGVVACCGTAVTERHIQYMKRQAERVVMVLDGDDAGQKATSRILELFVAADLDLRILILPQGLDPCDFLNQHGAESFNKLLASAVDALEHRIQLATRGIDLTGDTHGATQALESILATIAKAPRFQSAGAHSSVLREQQLLSRLAREFRVPEAAVRSRLGEIRHRNARPSRFQQTRQTPQTASQPKPSVDELNASECELLEILSLHPELVDTAVEQIDPNRLESSTAHLVIAIYQRLCLEDAEISFARVLSEAEDPTLKNVLVELDERSHAKSELAQEDAPTRLNRLLQRFHGTVAEAEKREKLAALDERRFDEHEELKVLQQFVAIQRDQQGISAPREG